MSERSEATIIQRFAQWVSELQPGSLPEKALAEARRCILDTEGVAIAARNLEIVARARGLAAAVSGAGKASLIGGEGLLAAAGAALVNGTAAHALDLDDWSPCGVVHASAAVWPAARAAAEEKGVSDDVRLAAFVAGVEVIYALGEAIGTKGYDERIWTTGVLGPIGAAAAAARVYGLDAAQTANAIALAAAQSFGVRDIFGTDAKALLVGKAAASGLEAAIAGRLGLTGPVDLLEPGKAWARHSAARMDHYEVTLPGRGQGWRIAEPGVAFKLYPLCSANAPAVEAALQLKAEHKLTAKDVASVHCVTTDFVASCLIHPRATTRTEAQFCLPFSLATALLDGGVTPVSLEEERISRPELQDLMRRVTMEVEPGFSKAMTGKGATEAARVRVTLKDGRKVTTEVDVALGGPGRPISTAALEVKYRDCCKAGGC